MPEAVATSNIAIWRRISRAAKPLAAPIGLFLLLTVFALSGFFTPLDNALMDARFRLIKRAPTDTLVLVEIDPQSIRDENRWPWPRDRYATAIANLQAAQAGLIAFDVDFSSLSSAEGDAAFARALAQRPGEVILPVFWQWSSSSGGRRELMKTPPNEKFLDHAVIASVTLTAEKSGIVRRGWRAVEDGDTYRTAIAGVLAGIPADRHDTFYIDYSIDSRAIKRLSFRDLLSGDFSPEIVRGKNILIGATALELGDEFAAPVLGVTPGVMLHALSYESLAQNRALARPHPAIPLVLGGFLLIWLCRNPQAKQVAPLLVTHAVLFAILFTAPLALQTYAPYSFDVGAILFAQAMGLLYVAGALLHHRARQIIRHRSATLRFQELTSIVVRDNADGVIVTDGAGAIELCNERATELLGFDSPLQSGAMLTELVADFPIAPALTTGPEVTARYEYAAPENGVMLEIVASRRIVSLGNTRARDNQIVTSLAVYTLRDISARKRIEKAELDAKNAAIAASSMKTQLISNMSHELRTPLNGVIGFAGIMVQESFGPHGVPEYQEYSQNIHECGKRLLGLVNNMLNIARLDAGEFELSLDRTSLADVVDISISKFENEAAKQNATISQDIQRGLPDVKIDMSVFEEMLAHLLSNALKFAGDGAKIQVRAKETDGDLLLEVEDNGCGVNADLLPKLTEAFFQGDGALNRAHEGAGLGLYLVSKYVALHGGDLRFESEAGSGFTAIMHFPGLAQRTTKPGGQAKDAA